MHRPEHYLVLETRAGGTRLEDGERFRGVLLGFVGPDRFRAGFGRWGKKMPSAKIAIGTAIGFAAGAAIGSTIDTIVVGAGQSLGIAIGSVRSARPGGR